MKCDNAIQQFLEIDEFNSLPLSLRLHLFFCPRCRLEIRSLTDLFNSFRGKYPYVMKEDLSSAIMNRISRLDSGRDFGISIFHWITVWIIILAGVLLLPFNEEFLWLINYFGAHLQLPVNIIMGLCISIYTSFYIGTHLHDLKRFHEFIKNRIKTH